MNVLKYTLTDGENSTEVEIFLWDESITICSSLCSVQLALAEDLHMTYVVDVNKDAIVGEHTFLKQEGSEAE